jgi:hypothetical protein
MVPVPSLKQEATKIGYLIMATNNMKRGVEPTTKYSV